MAFGPQDDVSIWRAMPVAACVSEPSGCFCEQVENSNVRQPHIVFSHVAYVLVAAYAMVDALLPGRDLTVSTVYAFLWGWGCLWVGLSGAFYHSSLTEFSEMCSWQAEVRLETANA